MTDRIEKLEAELSAMRPRGMSTRLAEELSATMSEPMGRPWSDRTLVFAMTMGALAACVIIGLLAFESTYVPPAPAKPVVAHALDVPDHAYAFARVSRVWMDDID